MRSIPSCPLGNLVPGIWNTTRWYVCRLSGRYGKQVFAAFPDEIHALCLDEIHSQATEANCRPQYKKVCGNIKKLFAFGGTQEAGTVIEELKTRYPRRPAMQDELNALAARLEKKKR
ncbi:MAG: hypothetical protein VB071_02390 [Lawsonibacter sp.]|nr:hypothetical protein [Lawsonibacter sp.]